MTCLVVPTTKLIHSAQLSRPSSVVEHLHGKEGVTSSILVGGSIRLRPLGLRRNVRHSRT